MNERIRELAEHANIRFGRMAILDGDPRGMARFVSYSEFEKFAEFIVRECANAAYQSLYEDRIFDDSPHIIRTKVMDDIKKHFGVEE